MLGLVVGFGVLSPLWAILSHQWDAMPYMARLWPVGYFDWFAAGMALAVLAWMGAKVSVAFAWPLAAAFFLFSTTTLAGPATLVPDQLSEALWKNVLYLATAAAIMAPLVLRGKEPLPDASISTTVAELPETASVEQAVSVREPATRAASASLAVLCVVLMMITLKLRDPRPLESRWEVPVNAKSADQRIRARCAMPVNESRSMSPEWMARWSLLTTTGQLLHRTRFWQHRDFGVAVAIRRPASGERVSAS